ncbi:putative quinol monooxygenase [Aestuariivirga sp.]|uniref:putative quinol monooxygenase n=1 Tax=Aestuariivirga sp. TaxID=2650926 RepID=UPI00359414A8
MGMIHLSGRLICKDRAEADVVRRELPEHIRLTRAEPGCVTFEVTATDDPLCWQVAETFRDRAAFEAHQARTRASAWHVATAGIAREFTRTED